MKRYNIPQSAWTIISLIIIQLIGTCKSQDEPLFTIPNFSNQAVRQDFCTIHRLVEQGKIERRDALRGLDLYTALFSYQLNAETGAIDEVNPGVAEKLLDKLASRAGFRWRNSYGVVDSPKGNQTWTDVLHWATNTYDLVGDWFVRSKDRVELGIVFSEYFVDASMIMVKKSGEKDSGLEFFNFLQPFSYGLWGLIAITLVLSGIFYHLIDYIDSRRYATKMDLNCHESVFNAAWMFTGHSLHEPKSTATRFLVLSLSFLCLLTVSAYTANLVSFLVARKGPEIIINDINDAMRYELSFCVERNGPNHEYMMKNHPTAKLVLIEEEKPNTETYHALGRSECDILLTEMTSYEINRKSSEYNPNCNIEWVGRPIESRQGCFAASDSPTLCTALVNEVLTIHMLEMKQDKTFDIIWQDFLSRSAIDTCATVKEQNETSGKLTVANMYGIFVLHSAVMLATLLWSLLRFYCHPNANQTMNLVEDVLLSAKGGDTLKRKASMASADEENGKISSECTDTMSDTMPCTSDTMPCTSGTMPCTSGTMPCTSDTMPSSIDKTQRTSNRTPCTSKTCQGNTNHELQQVIYEMCETMKNGMYESLKKIEENMNDNMNQNFQELQKNFLEKKSN